MIVKWTLQCFNPIFSAHSHHDCDRLEDFFDKCWRRLECFQLCDVSFCDILFRLLWCDELLARIKTRGWLLLSCGRPLCCALALAVRGAEAVAMLCTRGRRSLCSCRCSHFLWGCRAADRRGLNCAARVKCLLHCHTLIHSAQRIPSLEPSQLCWRVLV